VGVEQHADIGGEKADGADRDAGPEVLANDDRVDLRSGEEREKNRAEPGKEIDPLCEREPDRISGEDSDHDLDQRHRYRDANGDDRRYKRQTDP
jgi:hypothetical protein